MSKASFLGGLLVILKYLLDAISKVNSRQKLMHFALRSVRINDVLMEMKKMK